MTQTQKKAVGANEEIQKKVNELLSDFEPEDITEYLIDNTLTKLMLTPHVPDSLEKIDFHVAVTRSLYDFFKGIKAQNS